MSAAFQLAMATVTLSPDTVGDRLRDPATREPTLEALEAGCEAGGDPPNPAVRCDYRFRNISRELPQLLRQCCVGMHPGYWDVSGSDGRAPP